MSVSRTLRWWLGVPPVATIAPRAVSRASAEYSLGRELGSGRYGIVRSGRSVARPELGELAVKAVSLRSDAFVRSQLKSEIALLGELTGSANVSSLVDAFEDEESVYIVTPVYDGGELFDRIVELGTFSERDAAVAMRDVLRAVAFCHSKGVVHRDIKPENLLYASKRPEAPLVLIDFGMARKFEKGDTLEMECGSPSYVAPEVLARAYNEKCDLWSAGVILHVMLTGSTPYGDGTEEEILDKVRRAADLECVGPAWDGVSEEAKSLVSQLMRVDPASRPSADEALLHDFVAVERAPATTMLDWDQPVHDARVMAELREFNLHRKLKKAALRVLAAVVSRENRLKRLTAKTPGAGIDPNDVLAARLKPKLYTDERRLMQIFKQFDVSGDGFIDRNELKELLRVSEGVGVDPALVDEVLSSADANDDGRISFAEFCDVVRGGPVEVGGGDGEEEEEEGVVEALSSSSSRGSALRS